jgi:salicylate hydroxylase
VWAVLVVHHHHPNERDKKQGHLARSDKTNKMSLDNEDTEWGRAMEAREQMDPSSEDSSTPLLKITDVVDIAIIGGGLAGLAVAAGLCRRQKLTDKKTLSIKLYERAPQLRSTSQGVLGVFGNGMRALDHIHPDIPGMIAESGCEQLKRRIVHVETDGSISKNEESEFEKDEFTGKCMHLMTWHNMQQLLASLVPTEIIVTGHSLTQYHEEQDSVVLHFENGSAVRAGIVLACDGIFSVARGQMFADVDSPIFFGQLNWGSVTDTIPPTIVAKQSFRGVTYKGGKDRWMVFLIDAGNGNSFFQIRVGDPDVAMSLSGNKGRGGLGLPGVKERLLPLTKVYPDVKQAILNIPESQIFERSIVGRYPATKWVSEGGRVALVGDSAHGMHPFVGQGANSAFESVAILIDCIMTAKNNDWKAALTQYEKVRKPRADLVQRFANAMGVSQASGSEGNMSSAAKCAMMDWIRRSDEKIENAPAELVEYLDKFDPCSCPGIRLLW